MASSRSNLGKVSTIDITPLMDLTFMLLIIFIITVPAMEYSTDVTPPQMDTPKTTEDVKNKVVITLDEKGNYILDGKTVEKDNLFAAFKNVALMKADANLLIRSHGSRRYEEVIEVHRAANHAGLKNIFLVTQAEKK